MHAHLEQGPIRYQAHTTTLSVMDPSLEELGTRLMHCQLITKTL